MTKDKLTKTKFSTVPCGKACLVIIYIGASLLLFAGLVLLIVGDNIGFWILGVTLIVFVPIIAIMHYHNCANTITFVEDKIIGRRKTLTWDTAYLTIHCHKILDSRVTFVWLYFDDHYLTEKEVRSMRVARQGLYLRLNSEEAYFIYPHLKRSVKILDYSYGIVEESEAMYILNSYDPNK